MGGEEDEQRRREDATQSATSRMHDIMSALLLSVLAFSPYLAIPSCAAMVRLFSRVTISLTLPSKGSDVTNLNSLIS